MKKLAILLMALMLLVNFSCDKGNHAGNSDLDKLLARAEKTGKPVLLDVYATWCGPCKRLSAQVFNDKETRTKIDAMYVFGQIDAEKDNGPAIKEKYIVTGYPTVLILKADGTEIDRIIGYGNDKDKYMKILKDYARGINTLTDLLDKSEHDPENAALLYQLAEKYMARSSHKEAAYYFQKTIEKDPKDELGNNQDAKYNIASLKLYTQDNTEPIEKFLAACSDINYLYDGYSALARYFNKAGEQEKAIETYEAGLEKLGKNASYLNGYAWYIFLRKAEKHYERGIEIAQKAVEIEPKNDAIWDTLAQLCYAAGKTDEAIKAMTKANELAPEEESYANLLEKYKAN